MIIKERQMGRSKSQLLRSDVVAIVQLQLHLILAIMRFQRPRGAAGHACLERATPSFRQ